MAHHNEKGGKPDLNRASREELERAEGIDGIMADHIIKYRDENGPFRSAEDLKKVPGIGETRFDQVKNAFSISGGQEGQEHGAHRHEGHGRHEEGHRGGHQGGSKGGGERQY